jgi:hypothetical protein
MSSCISFLLSLEVWPLRNGGRPTRRGGFWRPVHELMQERFASEFLVVGSRPRRRVIA